jgi:hypothetical protein
MSEMRNWLLTALRELGGQATPDEVIRGVQCDHDVKGFTLNRALWDLLQAGEVRFVSMYYIEMVEGVRFELPSGELQGAD